MRRKRRKDNIDRLYDSFLIKDMTRKEFRKEYLRLTNQTGINQDLRKMVKERQTYGIVKQLAGEKKQEIDKAIMRSN
jgi:hypothetical protein